jgi:hypothetical protein
MAATEADRKMRFHGPEPSPIAGAMTLIIALHDDGTVAFGAGADSAERLLGRMEWLLRELNARPSLLAEACGVRGVARHLFERSIDEDAQ